MTDAWRSIWLMVKRGPRTWSPAVFFVYDLLIVGVLLALGPFHPSVIHTAKWLSNPFSEVLPGVVPWAGALGGVCISLVGVAGHAQAGEWRPQVYGYWHLTRSLLGAFFGSVAVLIVSLLLQNVKQAASAGGHFTTAGTAVLAVIAFVVGFREETFRSLIIRAADVILGPSATDAANPFALVPGTVTFEGAEVGKPSTATIHLLNASKTSFTLGSSAITSNGPGLSASLTPDPTTIAGGDSAAITLTWKPAGSGPLTGSVSVKVPGSVLTASVTGSAT